MLTKQAITQKLNISADVLWQAVRSIDRLDVWFPLIETCRVQGTGVGALRYMTIVNNGGDIQDRIEQIDDGQMKLVYVRPVSPFPVSHYQGTVEVFRSYDGLGVIVWTIDFESKEDDAAFVADLVKTAISAGIAGMEQDLQH